MGFRYFFRYYIITHASAFVNTNKLFFKIYTSAFVERRNFVRQGKASEGNEAVVTYGESPESML